MKDSPEKLGQLVRALNLIPYLHQHPDATPMEIARNLGYPHTEVMEDLKRLQMSGVGKGPGEMIDLSADWTGITLIEDQGLNAPLRLTPTEANALLLTLESLETMPGLVDQTAVASAAQKLRDVMHDAGVPDSDHAETPGPARMVSQALTQRCMLEITYYSATSDTTRTRTVSPVGMFHRDGATYLSARTAHRKPSAWTVSRTHRFSTSPPPRLPTATTTRQTPSGSGRRTSPHCASAVTRRGWQTTGRSSCTRLSPRRSPKVSGSRPPCPTAATTGWFVSASARPTE